jgi:hypothetical protein
MAVPAKRPPAAAGKAELKRLRAGRSDDPPAGIRIPARDVMGGF